MSTISTPESCIPRQPREEASSHHPHRPIPDPVTGELKIDPDIFLKAKKFNLAIDFFYSSQSDADNEFGRGRLANIAGYALSLTNGPNVTIVRGDFSQLPYTII